MDENENENGAGGGKLFWTAVSAAADPAAYKPERSELVEVARLKTGQDEPYFVLKQPQTKSYLRLSESDYALWWQMDGARSIKQLLFYSLRRYRTLPIGHLNSLIQDLRNGRFLVDTPTNLYDQLDEALLEQAPASRGRRLINAFLQTDFSISGLDDFFAPLYDSVKWLFAQGGQLAVLTFILIGGGLFGKQFFTPTYSLTGQEGGGVLGILGLLAANFLIIGIHELAHGVATKHFGRELNRGGFLIYWGMPAFYVDTRDIWMSPRRARIAVSWAGPHSGMLIGGIVGMVLTAVTPPAAGSNAEFWLNFLFQIGFIAYLTVFFNLNPLLELDGYFILMDWLDMPGLRERAFHFWRFELWERLKTEKQPQKIWHSLQRSERIFTAFGALAFIYSAYAIFFAVIFWQTHISELVRTLWTKYEIWGRLLVLGVTAVIVIPTIYYLGLFALSRIQVGLEWLSRRNLLIRPDVLALLIGIPLFGGLMLVLIYGGSGNGLFIGIITWLIHLAAIGAIIGIARQLPGSQFQWAMWALLAAPVGLTISWLANAAPVWHDFGLIITAVSVLLSGIVSWFTVGPKWLQSSDNLLMGSMIIIGPLYYLGMSAIVGDDLLLQNGRWIVSALILGGLFFGLMFMSPLLINFRRSRFALPWLLFVVAIIVTPWLQFFPFLHLPIALLWLYAGLLYLIVGKMAQFSRIEFAAEEVDAYDERSRLVDGFNYFLRAFFSSYETIFGSRRLIVIQNQIVALGPLDKDASIIQIGERAQQALLLAVDRLDDLAGTPFTRQAGQAAYDSLPWLHAETLSRHLLANIEWGAQLAQGFIDARDRRAELIRRADVFAGFDQDGVMATVEILQPWAGRDGAVMVRAETEATRFFLIEFGEVGIFHNGVQVGKLTPGGYFGTMALMPSGPYRFTYRTLTQVKAVVIYREKFDPLLRADTTLAGQVNSGAQKRQLLRQMPLFSSLSPQQLATVDAQLSNRRVSAGEQIVTAGEARSYLFIVAEGQVEVVMVDAEEGEMVIGRLGVGEHFGEYALFADTPYQATYRAVGDAYLLLLDEPKFDELVAQCDRMSNYVEQIGSGRLIATRRRSGPSGLLS